MPEAQTDIVPFEYRVSCRTAATEVDGSRHNCYSDRVTNVAPVGYVYNKDTMNNEPTSWNGSEYQCQFQWDDYVEIIKGTGIKMPRTVRILAYALSPVGPFTGTGWADCRYRGELTKIMISN